jgi:murein DD-endopeptidase MepM/ murein hydrolase activator NlpD
MKLTYPLSSKGTKTSGYGYRTHPVKGTRTHHNGVDIGVPDGTEVYSVADGEVVRSDMRDRNGYGNFIIIKHSEDGETFYSAYAHLTKRLVEVGDEVNQGDKIALSGGGQGVAGGGGLSTGPHLHFEIRKSKDGDWVNPEPYISGSEIVKGDISSDSEEKKSIKIEDLVVTYDSLTGKSKKIADTVISELKNKGINNPYAIIVICTILIQKYGVLNENSFSKKLLGPNSVTIPPDGAHAGQKGWQSSNAWDIKAPIGSPVFAINSGNLITWSDYGENVTKRGGKKLYGESFTVKSDNELPSVYYTHLKDTTVRKGDNVECGQLLGYVMDFPGSSYDHVHIGIESGNIKQFINSDGTLKCKVSETENFDKDILSEVSIDLGILIKDKNTINNFKSLDEAINYYSNIELSDGSKVSKETLRDKSSMFRTKLKSDDSSSLNIKDLIKSLLKIPELGAKIRKEKGLDENTKLNEEINQMKNLIKKIL